MCIVEIHDKHAPSLALQTPLTLMTQTRALSFDGSYGRLAESAQYHRNLYFMAPLNTQHLMDVFIPHTTKTASVNSSQTISHHLQSNFMHPRDHRVLAICYLLRKSHQCAQTI